MWTLESIVRMNTPYSRREILELIQKRAIQINGKVAEDLTAKVDPKRDKLTIRGKAIRQDTEFLYYKFNKPRGVISTMEDPKGRRCLAEFLSKIPRPVFPIGRLDRESSGLLIFTNDGHFSQGIAHPRFAVEKRYLLRFDKPLSAEAIHRALSGFFLEDGPFRCLSCTEESDGYEVIINEGRNRILRRAFEYLGYQVQALHRLSIGPFSLDGVKPGKLSPFSAKERDQIAKYCYSEE